MYSLGYGPNGKVCSIQKDGELYVSLGGNTWDSESTNTIHYQEFLIWNKAQKTPLDLNSTIEVVKPVPPRNLVAEIDTMKVDIVKLKAGKVDKI